MAVSPNVDAYMAQSMQQAPLQTAEDTFVKEFGNQAFNALRAKYPSIADRVITFRTLLRIWIPARHSACSSWNQVQTSPTFRASWPEEPSHPARWGMTRQRTSFTR